MMKALRYSIYALVLVLGAEILNASTLITVKTSAGASDESRRVSGFTGISSAGSFDVFVTMGNSESLRLEGDADDIKEIETVVEQGVLKIRTKKGSSWVKSNNIGDVNIYITAKSLTSLTITGSGNIQVKNVVKGNDLKNTVTGSGSMELTVDVDNYSGTVTGSGELTVKGTADNARITVTGSGDFDGAGLRTSNSSARVSGSGDIVVGADKALDAVTSGSGDIKYRGNASVKSSTHGSGKILKL